MPFNIGAPEILIILLVALLILGPSKLPQMARSLGEALREFRKAASEFSSNAPSASARPQTPSLIPAEARSPPVGGSSYDRELLLKVAEKLGVQVNEKRSDEELVKEIIDKAKQQGLV